MPSLHSGGTGFPSCPAKDFRLLSDGLNHISAIYCYAAAQPVCQSRCVEESWRVVAQRLFWGEGVLAEDLSTPVCISQSVPESVSVSEFRSLYLVSLFRSLNLSVCSGVYISQSVLEPVSVCIGVWQRDSTVPLSWGHTQQVVIISSTHRGYSDWLFSAWEKASPVWMFSAWEDSLWLVHYYCSLHDR